ncbi:MAG: RdgB/HAM1 family non-canonical purine NTP pyrophosphatase [Betaproteobacteria bacterium]
MLKNIVLASSNAGKLLEFHALLSPLGIELISQESLNITPAEEPFFTFVENSLTKARHASKASGMPALADDSGICVEALQGAPGILSARFSGKDATDELNNQKLISLLKNEPNKKAHYVCAITLVRHSLDPEPLIAIGRWHGEVIDTPRGKFGFGYDPYFFLPSLGLTAAEISLVEKNKISHRSIAMAELLQQIKFDFKR